MNQFTTPKRVDIIFAWGILNWSKRRIARYYRLSKKTVELIINKEIENCKEGKLMPKK